MINLSEYTSIATMPWLVLFGILSAGFALGLLFFASLWLTTAKILHSRHPVVWMLGGFIVRMALVLPALYWLTDAHWQKLLACLLGFIVARFVVIRISVRWQQVTHAS